MRKQIGSVADAVFFAEDGYSIVGFKVMPKFLKGLEARDQGL
ncbi:hypothetical protein C5167_003003 [Papaver somniferum]|uniref:Uncharacterized protein n=1 Tax=Papaver somniferum TaxID=3469 RepID=A0A4Y7KY47_PAPSO|nr:hypothetical protein C5167_003003 [Papaver somniferum]